MNLKFWNRSSVSRLGNDERTSGPGLLARLLRDEAGSFLLYMTVAIPIFIGLAGLATEGSLVFYNHRTIQSAADSAAYSAAIAYSNGHTDNATLTTQAKAIVASYGFVINTSNVPVNDNVDVSVLDPSSTPSLKNYGGVAGLNAIQVNLSRPQLPILSSIWQKNPFDVGGSAIAIVSGGNNPGNCVLMLGKNTIGENPPSAPHAIDMQGNPVINTPGCGIFSNSTSCSNNNNDSIHLQGSYTLASGSIGSAGCVGITGNGGHLGDSPPQPGVTNNYTEGDGEIMDPYAGTAIPTTGPAGSCNAGTKTCSPGVYSSGTTLKGGTWTLQPGIYVMQNEFKVGPGGGGTVVNGTNVTLVFTSATPNNPNSYPNAMMEILSGGEVHLTAPTTGPTAGFVIMGDSTMPENTDFSLHANPNSTFTGTVYLPNGYVEWGGTPSTFSPTCLQIISNTMKLYGNSTFSNTDCNALGPGQKPIGSVVTLVN